MVDYDFANISSDKSWLEEIKKIGDFASGFWNTTYGQNATVCFNKTNFLDILASFTASPEEEDARRAISDKAEGLGDPGIYIVAVLM